MRVKIDCKRWECFYMNFEVLPSIGDFITYSTDLTQKYPEMEVTSIVHNVHSSIDGEWDQFIVLKCYEVED